MQDLSALSKEQLIKLYQEQSSDIAEFKDIIQNAISSIGLDNIKEGASQIEISTTVISKVSKLLMKRNGIQEILPLERLKELLDKYKDYGTGH